MKAFSVLLSAGAAVALASVALANPQYTGPIQNIAGAQTDTDANNLVQTVRAEGGRGSSILYDSRVETGSRFNPGVGGDPAGSGQFVDATFDDIPIPNSRLFNGNATSIEVTRVTVGIRQAGLHAGSDVTLAWTDVDPMLPPVAPNTELGAPNVIGTGNVGANPGSGFRTVEVTLGDGVNTLFTTTPNYDLFGGFGTFFLGVVIDDPSSNIGWRITSGADISSNAFWIFDIDLANPERGPLGFTSGTPAIFYALVEGRVIPTPGALTLAGAAGLVALRRRRA